MADRLSYTASVVRQLQKDHNRLKGPLTPKRAAYVARLINSLNKSVHYTVDMEELKKVEAQVVVQVGDALHIPHEAMTLAYEFHTADDIFYHAVVHIARTTVSLETFTDLKSRGFGSEVILATVVVGDDAVPWAPVYAYALIDAAGYKANGVLTAITYALNTADAAEFGGIDMKPLVAAWKALLEDVCRDVLTLCAALRSGFTEERVAQEAHPRNNARVLQGKLPIWETKTLTITLPPQHTVSEYKGGTHASPRQHLRRGHYRHYKKTGKIAWVNQCTVGSLTNGYVHKDYRVEAVSAH
jgi:hypothetical protein